MGIRYSNPSVFLSYAGSEREQAVLIRDELTARGINVTMDDSFDPGTSVLVNVGNTLERTSLVLGVVSEAYLDRHFTEIEISAAMASPQGRFLPVIIGGEPVPKTQQGMGLWAVLRGRSYFKLELAQDSFDRLAVTIRAKFETGVVSTANNHYSAIDMDRESVIEELSSDTTIVYDWEDGYLVNYVEKALANLGIRSAELTSAAAVNLNSGHFSRVAVLWSEAALTSAEVSRVVLEATARGTSATYLQVADQPLPPADSRVLRLSLDRQMPSTPDSDTALPNRRARLDLLETRRSQCVTLNDHIPFHILGDKFCIQRAGYRAAQDAYRLAVAELPVMSEIRLQSVRDYAAACRFRGDWNEARDVLTAEPISEGRPTSTVTLALEADLLSLEFELGRIAGIVGRASTLLARCLAASDWPTVIAMHRQLGMIHEEQGSYSSGRDHMSLAFHYSEDLLDTPLLEKTIPPRDARLALAADCLRELAALEWRAGDGRLATRQLLDAIGLCDAIGSSRLKDYMTGLLTYQRARVDYSLDRDYEKAKGLLNRAYVLLQTFDNPVRTATVLESMARLEIDFLRGSDERVNFLRPTLEKIQRIRQMRHHDYMIARSLEALGDLEYALGDWPRAVTRYEEARRDFNRLGKQPEAASTAEALARCYTRMGRSEDAIEVLESALENLRDSDQRSVRANIRCEIVRLLHKHVQPSDVDDAMVMTGVGEFSVHRWIAKDLLATPEMDEFENLVVGVGDDCAVLRLSDDEYFAISTDSVPPKLLNTENLEAATYASRFAIVSSLSDVLAMGGTPISVLLNLHLPRDTPAKWARTLLQSADIEARRFGARIVGGDLKERPNAALTTVAIGSVQRGQILTRSAARPGHLLAMTLSGGSDGLFHGIGRRWAQELAPYLSTNERLTISGLLEADAAYADLGLPLGVIRDVMQAGIARAGMDTSDGLLACAQLIGEASDVGIELDARALDKVISDDVRVLADALGVEPLLFGFNGGHDWEVVFSSPSSNRSELEQLANSGDGRFPRLAIIGHVVPRASWSEDGVRLIGNGRPCVLPYFTDEKFVVKPYERRAGEWLEFAREATRLIGLGFGRSEG